MCNFRNRYMLKKRDAQGLSLQFIIIAAIMLVVLVVVIAIFVQRMRESSQNLESCGVKGGVCRPDECEQGETKTTIGKCDEDKNEVCCLKVLEND